MNRGAKEILKQLRAASYWRKFSLIRVRTSHYNWLQEELLDIVEKEFE
jgi:hypothetical protein